MDSKFGWNPKVGDRVEGVTAHGGTGHFGTVVGRRRDGFVVEWDNTGSFKRVDRASVHQSYGLRKVKS